MLCTCYLTSIGVKMLMCLELPFGYLAHIDF